MMGSPWKTKLIAARSLAALGGSVHRWRRWPAVCVTFALAVSLVGCDADLQKLLDDLSGTPSASSSSSSTSQTALNIPPGPHLYCITNIGHTLVLYDLAVDQPDTGLQTFLDLDPVGPWFYGGRGYYVSRVDTSGRGANALIEFDPKTALPTRQLGLRVNTNPNNLFILPGLNGKAWIPVRGSTFNSPYGPDGIAVVDLNAMSGTLYCFLTSNVCTNPLPLPNGVDLSGMHSIIKFVWDATCPANGGHPCAYAIVNGFSGTLPQTTPGTLLVLAPDANGIPTYVRQTSLGINPLEDAYLDTTLSHLWVVNNGGYQNGATGTLQVIDTSTSALTSLATLSAGYAPTGVFGFSTSTAWVTTYPNDLVMSADLTGITLTATPNPALPPVTGSMLTSTLVGTQVFAGAGQFGPAVLQQINPSTGNLIASNALQAGDGTVSCAEFNTP
jgi:hypothetical protein